MSTTQDPTEHQFLLDLSKHLVKAGLYFVSIPSGWPCSRWSFNGNKFRFHQGQKLEGFRWPCYHIQYFKLLFIIILAFYWSTYELLDYNSWRPSFPWSTIGLEKPPFCSCWCSSGGTKSHQSRRNFYKDFRERRGGTTIVCNKCRVTKNYFRKT